MLCVTENPVGKACVIPSVLIFYAVIREDGDLINVKVVRTGMPANNLHPRAPPGS